MRNGRIVKAFWAVSTVAVVAILITVSLPLLSVHPASAAIGETVTFAENDSPSDPAYALQSAEGETPLTLFVDLSPAFSNPGYTFVDWNTEPNGSGTSYTDGETFDFVSTPDPGPVLYAIWEGLYETVTFAENDSGTDSVVASQTENGNTALTLFANLSPHFSNPGFTFAGWNTEPNGSGTSYTDGESYSFLSPLVVYAQWDEVPPATVTFDANGGVGDVSPLTDPAGTSIVLPSGSGLSFSGYTFSGWNTEADGSGTEFATGQSIDTASSETLYAQWNAVPPVTVTFSDNGGTGSETTLSDLPGTTVTLPSGTALLQSGYSFIEWNS
ncbi:MAG TPA: InlB B-repeat-containing protein, partial [Acidimicrobiales bacterium]|nr:InlB B-repeat-containing protein [Acidimicrobiales bacterium]